MTTKLSLPPTRIQIEVPGNLYQEAKAVQTTTGLTWAKTIALLIQRGLEAEDREAIDMLIAREEAGQ